MISCTEFIPAYSQLFKFLESKGGKKAVEDYWAHSFGENTRLKKAVEQNGIRGCWIYWNHTLNEEAANFTMELDEQAGKFKILMHHCPSKGRLLQYRHIEPYHDYCRHCDCYGNILEPLGYKYTLDLSQCDKAKCTITVEDHIS
ncbi:MAG: hypothetical protein PHP06_10330 [Clostridia bacterium]|nr:hypothetical protein [Clostridia bacterium]